MDIILFWVAVGIIVYTYLGYGAMMGLMARLRRPPLPADFTPPVVMVIPAYNEAAVIDAKIADCRRQDYPPHLLKLLVITDGSTDGTPERLRDVDGVTVLHARDRAGKTSAMNRAVAHVRADPSLAADTLLVFTDANTQLNPQAVRNLARHFAHPEVGCVAGEKRIRGHEHIAGGGESLYWRYESTIKRWESAVGDVMGAAGELFAVRLTLYQSLPPDTLLDDFTLSFTIAMQGYRLVYEPDAYALEAGSASSAEEWKRKVRNSAGGLQAILRLGPLLNPLRYGRLSWQYISHRVLRWTLTPVLLALLLPLNAWLAWRLGGLYQSLLGCQLLFYAAAWLGHKQERRGDRWRLTFVPYTFAMMNLAVFAGAWRFFTGSQDVRWERARRADESAGDLTDRA